MLGQRCRRWPSIEPTSVIQSHRVCRDRTGSNDPGRVRVDPRVGKGSEVTDTKWGSSGHGGRSWEVVRWQAGDFMSRAGDSMEILSSW